MKLKSDKLHFEIHPSRTKPIGYIRNSYREDGKIKHQTISKIHGVPAEQLKNMKAAFDGKSVAVSDIKITGGKEYGASATLLALAKRIGLDKAIYSRRDPWVNDVLAMIIGRIIYQGSKLSLSKVTQISHLWDVCGVFDDEIDVEKHCYDAMDELLLRQKLIQKKLASKHFEGGSIILYDITSTYFEGEYSDCEIVKHGYNRDKKRGKKQIAIGLICTKEGCPVAVEVFSGNTSDKTTVIDKIDEIKNTYGISDFVFVGDRGMLTQTNIDARPETLNITGLTHAGLKKLCEHDTIQISLFDEDTGTEVVLPEEPNTRYILRKNPVLAEEECVTRCSLIEKTEELLKEIQTPKKKTDDKTLAARAAKIFYKYKTEKYFNWDIVDTKIRFSRKESVIAECEQYDGLYVIKSNVSKALMDKREIVEAYKSLINRPLLKPSVAELSRQIFAIQGGSDDANVERSLGATDAGVRKFDRQGGGEGFRKRSNVELAFRNMKTVQLEIRPVHHRTEERIKAHVFICMLAYYLLWHMNKSLKPLYEDKCNGLTQSFAIELLKAQQKFQLSIYGFSIQADIVAEPNQQQENIQIAILGNTIVA